MWNFFQLSLGDPFAFFFFFEEWTNKDFDWTKQYRRVVVVEYRLSFVQIYTWALTTSPSSLCILQQKTNENDRRFINYSF